MQSFTYATSCRIELFGGLKVKYGPLVVTKFRTRKTATLLAYLALHPRNHTREALIELLWPECTLEAGRNSLNVSLNSLQAVFGSLSASGTPALQNGLSHNCAPSFLIADRHTIGLNRESVIVDSQQFESRLQSAALNEESSASLRILRHALEGYDRLLPEFYEDWISIESQRLEALFFSALRKLIAQLNDRGKTQDAIAYARRGLALDETREDIYRDLMLLLVGAGQSAAAYRQFQTLEELLRRRYEVKPDAITLRLARSIQNVLQKEDAFPAKPADVFSVNLAISKDGIPAPSDLPTSASASAMSGRKPPHSEEARGASSSETIETQVRAVALTFFDNLSQRRASANLPFFLRPDALVTGIPRGDGPEKIWQKSAEVYLDDLQRELINLAVDTPYLVETLNTQLLGTLVVASLCVINPWVDYDYLIVFTTEGETPLITSVAMETYFSARFQEPTPGAAMVRPDEF